MRMVDRVCFTFIGIYWAEDACTGQRDNNMSLQQYIYPLLEALGDNPTRKGLKDTPKRMAETLQFLTQGYHQSLEAIVNDALFPATTQEMIILKEIEFYSLCEHHLLPFFGKCHIAYLPNKHIL